MPCLYVGKFISYSVLSRVHQSKALPSVCIWATGDNVWVYLPQKQSLHQDETETTCVTWVLLLCGHSPLSQTIPAFAVISVTAEVPLVLQDSRADTTYVTNDLLNILISFLSVIQVNNSKKEFQVRAISLCCKDGSLMKRGTCVIRQIKVNLSTANECPFDRATPNSLDNKTLILCCWRIQKCSLKSREVFTEHQSLQHLLNRTNQTVGFLIKEHLTKWRVHVCVLSYYCKKRGLFLNIFDIWKQKMYYL